MNIIVDFRNCPEFVSQGHGYGSEVQQQFITSWIKQTTNATDRETELLKALITEHYSITSANKEYNLSIINSD